MASAIQVGLYETLQQQHAEALLNDEIGFSIQSSVVAGVVSGLTYLCMERVRLPSLISPLPRPLLTPFVLLSAVNAIRKKC